MATVTRPGWTVDNPSQSSSIIRANVPTKFAGGLGTNVLVKSNISNGNYDVYQPSVFGDKLIYSRNASNNKLTIHDQSTYDEYFNKSRPIGQQNFDALDKKIKIATYDQAQLNTGTDPVNNKNFEKIKESAAYKSLSNTQKPGERLPGADTPSPADGDAAATAAAQQAAAGLSTAINLDTGGAVGRNGVGTYGNLFYPLDLGNTFQDKIRFTIIEYKPRGLEIGTLSSGGSGSVKNAGSFGLRPKGNILGSVTLPIPGGISDTNTVGWQDNTMNAFQLAAANVAMKSIQEGFGSGAEALGSAAEAASQGPANQELKDAIAPFFAALAMQGDASALISRTQGAVLNPNLELLFNGPELRSFSFTFKMSARSKQEGDEIVKIIRAFKQSMSAQKSTAQLFVKAPNIYKIEYLHKTKGDNIHKRIGRIKECALMSFTTNYTPEGQYATYYDGTMVSYEIQMQFKELEPIFNNEYTGPDTEIGF